MFKFLKEKIKTSVKNISEKIKKEKEVVEEPKEKKEIPEEKPTSLPITRAEALELINQYNKDKSDLNHYLESEAIMKALAKKLGEDEETWGMLGLLHDIDWGITKDNVKEHLTKAPEILKKAGFNEEFIEIVLSHGYGFDCAGLENKKRTKKVEYALACSETVTGLIHAYILIRGAIEGMEVKGLKKRIKDKRFAAAINREIIKECEKIGLDLDEFLGLAINAVKEIAGAIGFKEVEVEETKEEKKGIFGKLKEKVITTKINEDKFNELFQELEISLLENNVAYEVIDKIKADLKNNLVEKPIKRGEIEETILNSLKESLNEILIEPKKDLIQLVKEKQEKPFTIVFFGVNGSGKTTSISKIAYNLKKQDLKSVLVAADTYRAAAIEQLEDWAKKLDLPIVKHKYKSDPAAVGFDGISMAKARNYDTVLIDTAGRLHSNEDLLREMQKIVRVTKPDLKLFIAESITGNDAVLQAKEFDKSVGIDGIVLTKSDVDEKGGAAISISYITKKPVFYIGTGQSESDLKPFNKDLILKSLNL